MCHVRMTALIAATVPHTYLDYVPQADDLIVGARRQNGTIWTPRNARDASHVPLQCVFQPPCVCIPDLDRRVRRAAGNAPAVWRELDT